jgi:hypothetical protein
MITDRLSMGFQRTDARIPALIGENKDDFYKTPLIEY